MEGRQDAHDSRTRHELVEAFTSFGHRNLSSLNERHLYRKLLLFCQWKDGYLVSTARLSAALLKLGRCYFDDILDPG